MTRTDGATQITVELEDAVMRHGMAIAHDKGIATGMHYGGNMY